MEKEKLWTKDFFSIFVINFFLSLVFYLLMVSTASYAIDRFHASTSTAGLVSGIFIFGSLVGRILTGRVIESVGSKTMLVFSIIFNLIASVCYFLSFNLQLLIINRVLHGFISGIGSTSASTIIAQIISPKRRGEGIGYYSLSGILGTSIGPYIGILLSQNGNYNSIFLCNIAFIAISLILSYLIKRPKQQSVETANAKVEKKFKLSNYIEAKAVPISLVSIIIALSYSSILTFMSIYAREINLVKAAGFFFFVYAIVVLLTRPFSGRMFDKKGENVVVYPCLIIYAIGMFLFSQAAHGFTLLLAAVIIAFGYGNYQSSAQAIAVKRVSRERLGLATSNYMMFFDLGFGLSPYIFGFIVPYTGYRTLYLMMGFVILLALILYYFLHGRKVSKNSFEIK